MAKGREFSGKPPRSKMRKYIRLIAVFLQSQERQIRLF
ncbi:conserved hypothetical protein [delta proteobacterium NaphS2]|nr:conserved hypothetical protein [delta proteobacterium NaphS2]